MPESLLSMLERYAASGVRAMHMPGHKRNATAHYLDALGAYLDITEIDGFDNLHDPSDVLKEAMDRAARLWGSRHAFFLVNGSTCGILAGIRALTNPGDKVIVGRNSHQSVFHALELMELDARYVLPAYDTELGIFGSVTPEAVQRAFADCPDARLLVVTSPTYEGAVSDIKAIAQIAHANGARLLVDEAHGAHLGFHDFFPSGAIRAGADVVIQSLHKTLPSITQTAIAHLGDGVDPERFQAQLAIFETSSPSYLLMASVDGCVGWIEQDGARLFDAWANSLHAFDRAVHDLKHLTLPGHGAPVGPAMYAFDPSKILISTYGTNLTGLNLTGILRERFKIELEMAACGHALAMTGLTEPEDALAALAAALIKIDRACEPAHKPSPIEAPFLPERVMTIAEASRMAREAVPFEEADGRVSAQYAWAYPPGIPLIAPGERIDERFLRETGRYALAGIPLRGGPAERFLWAVHDA
jgi:arginine/lysine/ornithine decarboxylase